MMEFEERLCANRKSEGRSRAKLTEKRHRYLKRRATEFLQCTHIVKGRSERRKISWEEGTFYLDGQEFIGFTIDGHRFAFAYHLGAYHDVPTALVTVKKKWKQFSDSAQLADILSVACTEGNES
jgi:hypothetical protein